MEAHQDQKHSIASLLLFNFLTVLVSISLANGNYCFFSGTNYNIGDTWHPKLVIQGPVFCVTCQCLASPENQLAKINCSSTPCARGKCDMAEPDPCCKVCRENKYVSHVSTTSLPMYDDTDDSLQPLPPAGHSVPLDYNPEILSCMHNGRIYRNGQVFPSNTSGLTTNNPNECINCLCQDGLVTCNVKACTIAKCQKLVKLRNDCCPYCDDNEEADMADDDTEESVLSTVVIMDRNPAGNKNNPDCITATKIYNHGSKWHPVIEPFGEMECVQCRCQFGRIECSHMTCNSQENTCRKFHRLPGHCCPICIRETRKQSGSQPKIRSSPDELGAHSDSNEDFADPQSIRNRNLQSTESVICLPPFSNVAVYRCHVLYNTSGYFQFIFIGLSNMEMHTWTLAEGKVGEFKIQFLRSEDVAMLSKTFRFHLLGATDSKYLHRFSRREQKLEKKCESRCVKKIERLQTTLKLRNITNTARCVHNETQLMVPIH